MDLLKSIAIAASGLRAQSGRMQVISENIANADSTPTQAGGDRCVGRGSQACGWSGQAVNQ